MKMHPPPGWVGLLACLLACTGTPSRRAPALFHDGYPRGPGSFCALNPEGCPPLSAHSEQGAEEDLESPANIAVCLDACAAGGEVLANFCRRLKTPRKQALCWAASQGSKAACIGMCHALYK
jgi:hypothetical protein